MPETMQRRFARARERVAVRLIFDDGERHLEAIVHTYDISVSGVFLESEFFLKPGMVLDLEFDMPNESRTVRARGIIVREVRLEESGRGVEGGSGFALKFTEYYDDAKTVLASSFLIVELDEFIDDYLRRRTRQPTSDRELLREAIVAWEVDKIDMAPTEVDLLRETIQVESPGRIRRQVQAAGIRSPQSVENKAKPVESRTKLVENRAKPIESRTKLVENRAKPVGSRAMPSASGAGTAVKPSAEPWWRRTVAPTSSVPANSATRVTSSAKKPAASGASGVNAAKKETAKPTPSKKKTAISTKKSTKSNR